MGWHISIVGYLASSLYDNTSANKAMLTYYCRGSFEFVWMPCLMIMCFDTDIIIDHSAVSYSQTLSCVEHAKMTDVYFSPTYEILSQNHTIFHYSAAGTKTKLFCCFHLSKNSFISFTSTLILFHVSPHSI